MKFLIDSSVWISAMVKEEAWHVECTRLLDLPGAGIYAHALSEVFCTLTGGRRGFRMQPGLVAELIQEDYLPYFETRSLDCGEVLSALHECRIRGITGAAIYDYLHLVAARHMRAAKLYTLNLSHFQVFWRAGDPEVLHPADA